TGLRNARLNFRQLEETHLMENIIYNELRVRGYLVDVGIVDLVETDKTGKRKRKQVEVDFIATRGSEKYYIQSAFALASPEKVEQEQRSLLHISDSFKKIIIVADNIKVRRNEKGITTMGLRTFLLNENSLNI
ncbi:MAG: ATP-binding protein, partial [Acetatifactor sp.]|nr:ATP-binding protein [Acetatifactor sp.]